MPNMSLTRCPMPSQDPAVRSKNFDEVALGYTSEIAVEEAKSAACIASTNLVYPDVLSGLIFRLLWKKLLQERSKRGVSNCSSGILPSGCLRARLSARKSVRRKMRTWYQGRECRNRSLGAFLLLTGTENTARKPLLFLHKTERKLP